MAQQQAACRDGPPPQTCHETNSIVGRGSIARQQRGTADQQPGPHRTVEILTIRHDISRRAVGTGSGCHLNPSNTCAGRKTAERRPG
jgi:hypothetical protein